jgi:hypothetical protein
MSFAFPTNPNPGDTYTGPNNVEYTWDGTKWIGTVASTEGGGGVTDHGALTGLEDDDHPQYVSKGADNEVAGVKISVVAALPATPDPDTLYFVVG